MAPYNTIFDMDTTTLGDFTDTITDGGEPDNACVNYSECGNVVPGRAQMCGECLDEARARDRNN